VGLLIWSPVSVAVGISVIVFGVKGRKLAKAEASGRISGTTCGHRLAQVLRRQPLGSTARHGRRTECVKGFVQNGASWPVRRWRSPWPQASPSRAVLFMCFDTVGWTRGLCAVREIPATAKRYCRFAASSFG
jgi:hypothetical protein